MKMEFGISMEHEMYIKARSMAIESAIEDLVVAERMGMGDDEQLQKAILDRYNLTDNITEQEALEIIAEVNARASL